MVLLHPLRLLLLLLDSSALNRQRNVIVVIELHVRHAPNVDKKYRSHVVALSAAATVSAGWVHLSINSSGGNNKGYLVGAHLHGSRMK